jgi:hypothetical protein
VALSTRIFLVFIVVVLLLSLLAACAGGDGGSRDANDESAEREEAVLGSFIGQVSGTEAFVALVAEPAGAEDAGAVQIYVSDGTGLSEWLSGSISDNAFVAESDDGDAEATGELRPGSVTGTVELPDGTTGGYEASPPSGPAGLYDLTVSPAGELRGTSAAGLGVTGEIPLIAPEQGGTGVLRLVDGTSVEFAVTRTQAGLAHLRAGQVRLILLTGGELRGAGAPPDGTADVFVRSAPT